MENSFVSDEAIQPRKRFNRLQKTFSKPAIFIFNSSVMNTITFVLLR